MVVGWGRRRTARVLREKDEGWYVDGGRGEVDWCSDVRAMRRECRSAIAKRTWIRTWHLGIGQASEHISGCVGCLLHHGITGVRIGYTHDSQRIFWLGLEAALECGDREDPGVITISFSLSRLPSHAMT